MRVTRPARLHGVVSKASGNGITTEMLGLTHLKAHHFVGRHRHQPMCCPWGYGGNRTETLGAVPNSCHKDMALVVVSWL
jgi:hypothetical protein